MLSELIQHLIDQERTTVKQLAAMANVCPQTIRNWLDDKGHPTEVAIRGWMTLHPSEAVRAAVLREMTDNKASFAQPASEPDLDFNKDGKVNLGDAMSATIKYEEVSTHQLKLLFSAYQRDPDSISTEDLETLVVCNETSIEYMQAINKIATEKISRRRKAKQPGDIGLAG